ncbi:rRNA biogenesis protein rrp5, partial [Ascosphaera acerosa]
MAFKRKESTRDENPKKRAKVTSTDKKEQEDAARPGKRVAKEANGSAKTHGSATAAPALSTITIREDEETPFPRGGASVLTPLEQKQISLQAKKDVLFEQTHGKSQSKSKGKSKKGKKLLGGDELDFSASEGDDDDDGDEAM